MRRFLTPKGIIGIALVAFFAAVAIAAPFLVPADYATHINILQRLKPPSLLHPFGTDQLGRALIWRVMLGAHTSLVIAIAAVVLSIVIGLPIGLAAGYYGSWIDQVLMRIVETLLSFPALVLALTISAVLGPSEKNTILAIGVAFSPYLARIVRGETLRVSALPYIEAARSQGATNKRIIILHVLPNIMAPLIVQATISVAFAILAEAALSFLGLGTQPPTPSWGLMIQSARDYLDVAPWTALVPGFAIAGAVLGLNILGDVLRDVLDPSMALAG